MKLNTGVLALGGVMLLGLCVGQADAQLLNAGFETPNILDASQAQAWNPFNGARRRTVGDGLTPDLPAAHGGVAVIDLTPMSGIPGTEFVGLSSDALTDPLDPVSPRNNVSYTFDPPNGPDIELSTWFMIPATDPVVGQRAGLKLEFRRTANNSVYQGFDFFFVDPDNPASFPGLVAVTTPGGAGVHTNGQWLHYTGVFHQSQFELDANGQPFWPLPPVNPDAKFSVLCIRFGNDYDAGARGTVFYDDVDAHEAAPCAADFNGSGAVSVQDIFDFLAAYFASDPSADINNSGGVTVQDIFDYLSLYFTGC